MKQKLSSHQTIGLEHLGLSGLGDVYWNLSAPALYEHAIRRGEGLIAADGPLVVRTGQHTGRSANDKYFVREPASEKEIWWGKINQSITPEQFRKLHARITSYLKSKDVYVRDGYCGADPTHRLPIRIVTEYAWHSLFASNLFIPSDGSTPSTPPFTVIDAPGCLANPKEDGTRSETFIVVNLSQRLVLIGGTSYAGEIKKSIFTVMNYLMPFADTLPMHCSANIGKDGNTALFFGLSGTGKTTLSADGSRVLIGDDEHGWSSNGVFNFEGGCYAKMIRLSPTAEPEIYATTRRFGTVLENVVLDETRRTLDLDSDTLTENTRGAYPISFIPNTSETGRGGHPKHVIFLTADAFGVLPPVSRLTRAQALYHFLLGYTAKIAGTEKGITEPTPNFSACYGAPFMPLHPQRYAELLGQRIDQHKPHVWLINTGWSGGAYGVGKRISIAHTRAMVHAVLDGRLDDVPVNIHPVFGLQMPTECPGVPREVLDPRNTWADKAAYDAQAKQLAGRFAEKFREFADQVSPDVRAAAVAAG
ncbi:MAG: phosphoenolpyruvate carboxykinase (ATP) [Gammaproteobacteria bacterium]|nr:phosphoenolpyruvate carboxykinase (ATP) [Gammaproteobacteria bacterium]